jgi:hypothetical protein
VQERLLELLWMMYQDNIDFEDEQTGEVVVEYFKNQFLNMVAHPGQEVSKVLHSFAHTAMDEIHYAIRVVSDPSVSAAAACHASQRAARGATIFACLLRCSERQQQHAALLKSLGAGTARPIVQALADGANAMIAAGCKECDCVYELNLLRLLKGWQLADDDGGLFEEANVEKAMANLCDPGTIEWHHEIFRCG